MPVLQYGSARIFRVNLWRKLSPEATLKNVNRATIIAQAVFQLRMSSIALLSPAIDSSAKLWQKRNSNYCIRMAKILTMATLRQGGPQ